MSNPTTPFSWQMPTNTDLVTDLPADFEVFGQAVATSMADLLGGTSGQILAKNSNTDMDFVWIANDQGDITGVTATSPLTGGGTSGAITVGIQASSTTQSGAVQLSDSTSTTSSVLASTPTATKASYDLAAAAIPKSTVTTAGDVIYATGSSAVTRLGIGTTGQVLTVASGVPSWATPSSGSTFSGVFCYRASTYTTTTGAGVIVPFDTERFDTDGFHNNSTNNSRLTVPSGKAGKYWISFAASWGSNTNGDRAVSVRKNGSTYLCTASIRAATGSSGTTAYAQTILDLTVGDYIEMDAFQSSNGNLDLQVQDQTTYISMYLLGA
jgi:hypothetical protein